MSNDKRVTFRIPTELADLLKQKSDQFEVPTAEIIRDLLQKYLHRLS